MVEKCVEQGMSNAWNIESDPAPFDNGELLVDLTVSISEVTLSGPSWTITNGEKVKDYLIRKIVNQPINEVVGSVVSYSYETYVDYIMIQPKTSVVIWDAIESRRLG